MGAVGVGDGVAKPSALCGGEQREHSGEVDLVLGSRPGCFGEQLDLGREIGDALWGRCGRGRSMADVGHHRPAGRSPPTGRITGNRQRHLDQLPHLTRIRNVRHVSVGKARVGPVFCFESRTATAAGGQPTSTQSPLAAL